MAQNRGKDFENVIKKDFLKIPDVSIDRLHDQTSGFKGSSNICDFVVYRKPYEYYIECKSVHGGSLPFRNITDRQWMGLKEKSIIYGVYAGIICWYIDHDITVYYPIQYLYDVKRSGRKSCSVRHIDKDCGCVILEGRKKRVFFNYDLRSFLKEVSSGNYR